LLPTRIRIDLNFMTISKVTLADKFARISEHWSPKIAGEINDAYVKLVKFQGDFVWHHHDHEDEMFLVIKGRMLMGLRDPEEREIAVNPGEFIVIPKGVEHRPSAPEETQVVLLEPKTTLNTGNVRDERTLEKLDRI
jgi:mannose-6-phosphate isomerase-like protein (cupin superfamily)